jgi:hypothetical protein
MKLSFTVFFIFVTISILFTINNLLADNIKIIEQPKSITECQGKQVTLSVDAMSDENSKLNYQWYKDNKIIPNASTPFLTFESINYENSGTYFCRIKSLGSETSVDSHPAAMYVLIPTSITKQPEDIRFNDVFLDSNIILSFDAHINGMTIEEAISVNEYVKIDWFTIVDKSVYILNDDETFNGTKSNNLSIKLSKVKDTSYYFAVVEGKCGSDTTRIVCVIKNLKGFLLTINTQDITVCENEIISLKSETNTNLKNMKIEYRWYKEGKPLNYKGNLKGIFTDELIFDPIMLQDAGKYRIEAQIKELNYRILSNEVNVKVNSLPKIICIRIDTIFSGMITINKAVLQIFYNYHPDSMYIDLYKNGTIIKTFNPENLINSTWWSKNNVNEVGIYLDREDIYAKYWAVVRNSCGIYVSDTVSIINDLNVFTNRDPWNQKLELCSNQKAEFQYDFLAKKKNIKYQWCILKDNTVQYIYNNQFIQGTNTNRLIFNQLTKEQSAIYFIEATTIDSNDKYMTYYSPHYNLLVKSVPVIVKNPKDKKVVSGIADTIFTFNYELAPEDSNVINLYYLPSLSDKPKLIKTYGIMGGWNFKYEKKVSLSDDGYYFASITNGNCDTMFTDTVKVTVVPTGSTTNIGENSDEEQDFSIYPNPAKDYIEINFDAIAAINPTLKRGVDEGSDIQIFDMLGVPVTAIHPMTASHRMNIENLSPGIYFIKIGKRVEKFVKM